MQKIKKFVEKRRTAQAVKSEREARRTVLEEVFNDMYEHRGRIYKVNFLRGIVFGAGSALGGTVVIALIVWTLSLFVNFPVVGELFKDAQQSIERTTDEATRQNRD